MYKFSIEIVEVNSMSNRNLKRNQFESEKSSGEHKQDDSSTLSTTSSSIARSTNSKSDNRPFKRVKGIPDANRFAGTMKVNRQSVVLEGVECADHVYVAWLHSSTDNETGFYLRPLQEAYRKTIIQGNSSKLYPNDNKNEKSMLEIMKFDYLTDRRDFTRLYDNVPLPFKRAHRTNPSYFPFKCFLWMRPSEGQYSRLSLHDWLIGLEKEISNFMQWCSVNEEYYGTWDFNPCINLHVRKQTVGMHLGMYCLDEMVVKTMECLYSDNAIEDLLNSDEKLLDYFGPNFTNRKERAQAAYASYHYHHTKNINHI